MGDFEVRLIPIADLHDHPRNSNRHGEHQMAVLQARFAALGWYKNVVVAEHEGAYTLLAGHGITRGAEAAGETSAPCHVRKLDPLSPEALDILEGDNTVADMAEPDLRERLRNLVELDAAGRLGNVGYDDTALDRLKAELAAEDFAKKQGPLEDPGPSEPPIEPVSKLGDVWLCGKHRVVCGDCTDAGAWDTVGGERDGRVAFWSPPYALGKSIKLSGNKARSQAGDAYLSGGDESEGWRALLDGMTAMASRFAEVSVVNVQPLAGNKRELLRWLADESERLCDILTWDKQAAQPPAAQGVMASRYEWLVILAGSDATRSVPLSQWRGTLQSVYVGPPQRNNEFAEIHGATFPVHLPAFVLGELCDLSTSVVDCCIGTGTTLIAAEQLGRVCYGIEIEPRYVDVAVRRWQAATGQTAILESTGEPFPVVT